MNIEDWRRQWLSVDQGVKSHNNDAIVYLPVKKYLKEYINRSKDFVLNVGSGKFSDTYLPSGINHLVNFDLIMDSFGMPGVTGTVDALPFASASFSVALSKQVYGFLDNPDPMISEMVRVLQPNGLLIIVDYIGEMLLGVKRRSEFKPAEVKENLEQLGLRGVRSQLVVDWMVKESPAIHAVLGRK